MCIYLVAHSTPQHIMTNQYRIYKHEIPELLLEYPCVKKWLTYSSPLIQHP